MKNNLITLVTLLIILIGCEKDNGVEYLYDETPVERINKATENYKSILIAPEEGWIGYYSPNNSFGAFTLLIKFDKDGNALLNSDYDSGNSNGSVLYRVDKT